MNPSKRFRYENNISATLSEETVTYPAKVIPVCNISKTFIPCNEDKITTIDVSIEALQSIANCFVKREFLDEFTLIENLIETFEKYFPIMQDLINILKEYKASLEVWNGGYLSNKPSFLNVFQNKIFMDEIQQSTSMKDFNPSFTQGLKINGGQFGCPPLHSHTTRMFCAIKLFEYFFKKFQIRIGHDAFAFLISLTSI